MLAFCNRYVEIFYADDQAVQSDAELRAYWASMEKSSKYGKIAGFCRELSLHPSAHMVLLTCT